MQLHIDTVFRGEWSGQVVAYTHNADSNEKRISELENRLKESKAENMNLKFSIISDKIDRVDRKIDRFKMGLEEMIDRIDRKIDSFKMGLEEKIDSVDRKIDRFKMGLEEKIDRVDRKIDRFKMGLEGRIDDVAKDVKTMSKDLSTIKTGLVVIACLCVAPQLSAILTFFK